MNNFFLLKRFKIIEKNAFRIIKRYSSAKYCLDNIRKYDYENFICTLLLDNITRSTAIAIRSFNVELSRLIEQANQTEIRQMRLKFWEETVDKCYLKDLQQIPKHPTAIELFRAISRGNLTKRYLKNLIIERQQNVNLTTFKTIEDLERYAENTVSMSYYLILEGSGVKKLETDHAASHLGKAQGIIQQLRIIPLSSKLNFIPIPDDILIKHRLSHENILRGKNKEPLINCVYEMASRAHTHLEKSRNMIKDVPLEARQIFLPALVLRTYLDKLEKVDYDIYHPRLQIRSWKLLPSLYFGKLLRKY